MDLLEIIKSSSNRFPDTHKNNGIDAIVIHIERAEKYWNRARNENDDVLFTDVIYRTNQAYEGALKEAYSIIAGKDPKKVKPYEIEKYLEEKNILKEKVLDSLKNYRKEWRNTSTHDHKIFFNEQEALLAIASVCTFCIILFEQISSKIKEILEKERVTKLSQEVIESIDSYAQLPDDKKILTLLTKSYEYIQLPHQHIREHEFTGMLTGFLKAVEPEISAQSDVEVGGKKRVDLVIGLGKKNVVVEIKKYKNLRHYNEAVKHQVQDYLKETGYENGVIMTYDICGTTGDCYTEPSLFGSPYISYIKPKIV